MDILICSVALAIVIVFFFLLEITDARHDPDDYYKFSDHKPRRTKMSKSVE